MNREEISRSIMNFSEIYIEMLQLEERLMDEVDIFCDLVNKDELKPVFKKLKERYGQRNNAYQILNLDVQEAVGGDSFDIIWNQLAEYLANAATLNTENVIELISMLQLIRRHID